MILHDVSRIKLHFLKFLIMSLTFFRAIAIWKCRKGTLVKCWLIKTNTLASSTQISSILLNVVHNGLRIQRLSQRFISTCLWTTIVDSEIHFFIIHLNKLEFTFIIFYDWLIDFVKHSVTSIVFSRSFKSIFFFDSLCFSLLQRISPENFVSFRINAVLLECFKIRVAHGDKSVDLRGDGVVHVIVIGVDFIPIHHLDKPFISLYTFQMN